MNTMEILLQCLDIFIANKHWPDLKPSELFKIILYTHNKGFLYTPQIDGVVQCVICAYRIPEVTDEILLKVPVEESGTILYIPFFLSLKIEENLFKTVRESIRIYLENNPDVTEIVLEDKNKKLKRYKVNSSPRGKKHEAKEVRTPSHANV